MTKKEFIDKLRAALNGRIPTAKVTENVNYYEDYINTEIRKGRTEQEVLASLGEPRLIAKTIIQTTPDPDTSAQTAGYDGNNQDGTYQDADGRNAYSEHSGARYSGVNNSGAPRWLVGILMLVVIFIVINIVFSVLSFLAPFILVIGMVLLMVKLFRDWLG